MPRNGYLSKDEDEFFEKLDKLMVLAKESLEIKRKLIENLTSSGLYPYSKFYLSDIKKGFGEYWKNHFSTIGLIGMNESCLNFLACSIGDKDGLEFANKVLDFMRNKLKDFQVETGNIYNLEATPAEGASYRLAKIDKKEYPKIITASEEIVGAKPYYTNSTQLPVNYTDDVFEALKLQDSLQTKYTGGTVFHIFIGENMPPKESIKNLVEKVCENFRLPYFTITPTFSICPEHGYIFGEYPFCPKCKTEGKETKCEIYSRIVGYLRPVDQWNDGKQEEFRQRKTFDKIFK
jgi:ribonucleoside-triphosphate reductase